MYGIIDTIENIIFILAAVGIGSIVLWILLVALVRAYYYFKDKKER